MNKDVNFDLFAKSIKQFTPLALKEFDIQDLGRIGHRVVFVDKKHSIEEAALTCLSITKAKSEAIAKIGKLIGCGSAFSIKYGDLISNIQINPGYKQDITINPNETKNETSVGVFIDIDVYTEGNLINVNIENFVNSSLAHIRNNIFPFLNGLG